MRPLCPIGHLPQGGEIAPTVLTDISPNGEEIVDCINSQLASVKLLDS